AFTLHCSEAEDFMDYPWVTRAPREQDDGFARCSLMDVRLVADGPGRLAARLPPDHEFPWPLARDCDSYLREEELMHECVVRRDFARSMGVRAPAPPAAITRMLTPAMRVALFG